MEIQGLQKLTLLDYPGKVACTVFFGGCDLRCPFCHNSELVTTLAPAELDSEEFFSFLRKRIGLLDGVCITGGEPLLRPDLEEFLAKVKELGFLVKLDTNGTHPQRLQALVEAKLVNYVAMDVKNGPSRYAETTGISDLDLQPIRESVAYLLSGPIQYEFRTTVVREFHNRSSFVELGPWLAGARAYFLQSFVDRDTVLCPGLHPCSREELEEFASLVRPYVPSVQLRGV
ncbi:MAG: anaerobic ribonucleoside-triphosphate reductase activating protein [Lawsonibacter sp.]|jgi:pyruvate formate lyase activating enzyme